MNFLNRKNFVFGGMFVVLVSAISIVLFCVTGCNQEIESPGEKENRKSPNVIFILMDALRYDAIHEFGNPNETTPNIDALLPETVVFHRAFSQATVTWTSVASIFTGLYPGQHKVMNIDSKLPDEIVTLPEIFRDHGYRTAMFSANINISPEFGFDQGIEHIYSEGGNAGEKNPAQGEKQGSIDAATLLDASAEWMNKNKDAPFFVYVHLMEPHIPYNAPDSYRRMFLPTSQRELSLDDFFDSLSGRLKNANNITPDDPQVQTLRSIYDGQVRYMDMRIQEFIERLKEMELYDKSIIVFCADHGEEFGEHGTVTHGGNVFNAQMHVPLFIRFPGGEYSGRIDTPVALSSSLLTAADYAGLPLPGDRPAKSFLSQITGGKGGYSTPVYAQSSAGHWNISALVQWPWKIIKHVDQSDPHNTNTELYNLESDFDETTDVFSSNPEIVKTMTEEIKTVEGLEYDAAPSEAIIDEQSRQKLKTLGYAK